MQRHKQWLIYAENDLNLAKVSIELPHILIVSALFSAHQCAEKALKAYLVFHAIPLEKVHDLIKLIEACSKIDSEFLLIQKAAVALNPYATKTRYPESYYPDLHTSIAEHSVEQATQIFEFVRTKIDTAIAFQTSNQKTPTENSQL